MNRKVILLWTTIIFGLVGTMFIVYPFVMALGPIEKVPQDAYEVDVESFPINSSRLFITSQSKKIESLHSTVWQSGNGLVVVYEKNKKFHLFWLPIWEGKVVMPSKAWGQHSGYCSDFGLHEKDGEHVLSCGTPNYVEYLTKQWYWKIDGTNLGEFLPNLMPVHFIKYGNSLYVYQYPRYNAI